MNLDHMRLPANPQNINEFADRLIEQAILAFGDGVAITEVERRRALLTYNVGLVRFIEGLGMVVLGKHSQPPRTDVEEEAHPQPHIGQRNEPYSGQLKIGDTVRLANATGKHKGQLVPVVALNQRTNRGLGISVKRLDGVIFTYLPDKVEPFVEEYRDYQIVVRERRRGSFYFVYGPDSYSAFPQEEFDSVKEARARIDRRITFDERKASNT